MQLLHTFSFTSYVSVDFNKENAAFSLDVDVLPEHDKQCTTGGKSMTFRAEFDLGCVRTTTSAHFYVQIISFNVAFFRLPPVVVKSNSAHITTNNESRFLHLCYNEADQFNEKMSDSVALSMKCRQQPHGNPIITLNISVKANSIFIESMYVFKFVNDML